MKKEDVFHYLRIMRKDNREAKIPFRASKHWIEINNLFDKELKKSTFTDRGIVDFRKTILNRKFGGLGVGNRKIFEMFLFLYYNKLKERDRFGILDKLNEPDDTFSEVLQLGKQRVSVDLLFAADNILSMAEIYPDILSQEVIVAELGAGWGCTGYVLQKVNPKARYLIFDLPESLAIAQTYLPQFCENRKVEFYKSDLKRVAKSELLNNDIRFFGAHQLEIIEDKSIDIFINVASFQEMTIEHIKKYFDLINRKVQGYLYTKNYIKWVNPQDDEDLSLQNYPWLPNWHKETLRQSDNFHNAFVAIFKT